MAFRINKFGVVCMVLIISIILLHQVADAAADPDPGVKKKIKEKLTGKKKKHNVRFYFYLLIDYVILHVCICKHL